MLDFVQSCFIKCTNAEVGVSILDGILMISRDTFLCAIISILLRTPAFPGKISMLSRVGDVFNAGLSLDVLIECLLIVRKCDSIAHFDDCLQVIGFLVTSPAFCDEMALLHENPNAKQRQNLMGRKWTLKEYSGNEQGIVLQSISLPSENLVFAVSETIKVLLDVVTESDASSKLQRLQQCLDSLRLHSLFEQNSTWTPRWIWSLYFVCDRCLYNVQISYRT